MGIVSVQALTDASVGKAYALLGDWQLAENHFEAARALMEKYEAKLQLIQLALAEGGMWKARGEDEKLQVVIQQAEELIQQTGAVAFQPLIEALRGA